MKKIYGVTIAILFILSMLTFAPIAQGATGKEMANQILGESAQNEPVPPAPVTEEGIVKAILNKLGSLPADVKKLVGKDSETAKAINKKDTEVAKAIRELENKKDTKTAMAIQNSESSIKSNADANMTLLLLAIIASLAIVVVVIFLSKIKRKKNKPATSVEVNKRLDELDYSIKTALKDGQREMEKNIPAATDMLVKKLDPFTFTIESRGHTIICTPSIDGRAYNSFHVPTSVKDAVSDPSKIKRSPITSQGKFIRWTQTLMDDFYDGKFNGKDVNSKQKRDLIQYVQDVTKEMVIS